MKRVNLRVAEIIPNFQQLDDGCSWTWSERGQLQNKNKFTQPKKQLIPAPTYDGTTDVETFLQQFDSIAAHNTWETVERGLWLRLALRGEAAKCVVSDHDAEIRNRLLQRYGLKESQAYLMLKKIKFRLGEHLNMFISQLRRILSAAHPNLGENELEAMAIEELLTQIPANHPAMWALRVKPPTTVQ